ncbi:hypothetical protein MJO28_013963 [Puccinia striiformis f. sp. tritici]|uniref:Uncharacterized protein n=1 Tax=Puccinia striiformis f. sp. tritici TaxID=168172 RepID=A0ACC0DW24_9BASI|nr:hypothetical protein MJO28_013963 [Puccinia striiformis f. sp. tritici]
MQQADKFKGWQIKPPKVFLMNRPHCKEFISLPFSSFLLPEVILLSGNSLSKSMHSPNNSVLHETSKYITSSKRLIADLFKKEMFIGDQRFDIKKLGGCDW